MALTTIHLPTLHRIASGKVRDLFALPDDPHSLLFVASDRLSAFDVVLRDGIPHKGAVLTLLSAHWFRLLAERLPDLRTHFLSLDLPDVLSADDARRLRHRAMRVRRLRVLPIEAIVRGYLAGSAWAEYREHGTVHGLPVGPGMQLSQRFPRPLYTPSTKAGPGQHDRNIHPDDAWKELGDRDIARRVEELSLRIYDVATAYAEERGILIADTKFEFAQDDDGHLYLIDEVLTPDSSRFWPKDTYEPGKEQDSFDKQFVRNWLILQGLKGKSDVALPEDVRSATEERYKEAFLKLKGKTFAEAISNPLGKEPNITNVSHS